MGKLIERITLRGKSRSFADRRAAGIELARSLTQYRKTEAVVLAVPSGGIPVAAEVARTLALPLDLLIVKKLEFQEIPDAGFGAVGTEGDLLLNRHLITQLGFSREEVEEQLEKTKLLIEKQNLLFRAARPFPSVKGRTVLIVDDGLASGYTILAAVEFVKKRGPKAVVVAVPTAPKSTVDFILPGVDELVCLNLRGTPYFTIADAYESFNKISDEEVTSILSGLS